MAYIERTLSADEQLVWTGRRHSADILFAFLCLATMVGLALVFYEMVHGDLMGIIFLGVAATVGLGLVARVYLGVATAEFAVTDRRVAAKTGWLVTTAIDIQIAKVETVAVQQGIFGRLFDYGNVVVVGSGGSTQVLVGIAAPHEFRRHVQEQAARLAAG